jgi:hypothetical protein
MTLDRRIRRLEESAETGFFVTDHLVRDLFSEAERRELLSALCEVIGVPLPLISAAVDDAISDPAFPARVLSGDHEAWSSWIDSVVARGMVRGER